MSGVTAGRIVFPLVYDENGNKVFDFGPFNRRHAAVQYGRGDRTDQRIADRACGLHPHGHEQVGSALWLRLNAPLLGGSRHLAQCDHGAVQPDSYSGLFALNSFRREATKLCLETSKCRT